MAAAAKPGAEQDGIGPGGDRGRNRDADMLEAAEQQQRQRDVDDHRDAGKHRRRARVLAGKKAGLQHADQHIGRQAGGDSRLRPSERRIRDVEARCSSIQYPAAGLAP